MKKLVGMQIVVEGPALYSSVTCETTPGAALKNCSRTWARDEARHHAYGVQYIQR